MPNFSLVIFKVFHLTIMLITFSKQHSKSLRSRMFEDDVNCLFQHFLVSKVRETLNLEIVV
jgi:hypothetical protein